MGHEGRRVGTVRSSMVLPAQCHNLMTRTLGGNQRAGIRGLPGSVGQGAQSLWVSPFQIV
jgi:hypothetical protein